MQTPEITIFIVLVNIIILVFIAGIIVFMFQYRKRKLLHEKEKAGIEKQHKVELLNTQLEIQQQTMQFIGSEIHDSVAQKLILASIYSQNLEFLNQHPDISDKLVSISRIINDSLEELRSLSRSLTDSKVQNTLLADLLNIEVNRVNDAGSCKATLESNFDGEISVTVKSFLLRVIQEFIQNSLKHSGCNSITIQLDHQPVGLNVTANDNGAGFETEQIQSKGIGLSNMKRRIHLVGGIFDLQSAIGSGTTLKIFIPEQNLISS